MIKELTLESVETLATEEKQLVLFNDDYNSFDWVILSLVETCGHTQQQAAQCAWIVHFKGKYAVKSGSEKDLEPRCTALLERGLKAEIQ